MPPPQLRVEPVVLPGSGSASDVPGVRVFNEGQTVVQIRDVGFELVNDQVVQDFAFLPGGGCLPLDLQPGSSCLIPAARLTLGALVLREAGAAYARTAGGERVLSSFRLRDVGGS